MNEYNNHISEYDVLGSAMKLVRMMKRRERPEGGRSRGMLRMLSVLGRNPGISPKELAERLEIRPASLSERIARMESEALVRREAHPSDQRRVQLFIMPAGEKMLMEAKAVREEDRRLVSEVLSEDEQKMFCDISEKLISELEKQDTEGGK